MMMRPLWLDFQRPPPGPRRLGGGLLLAGLVVAAVLFADYRSVAAEIEAAEQDLSRLRREADLARQAVGDAESAAADELAQGGRSTAEWEALLATLEAAADETTTLLTLRSGGDEIQIGGEAKDLAAASNYVKRLQAATVFMQPHLVQSERAVEHPQHPVRFTVAARWRESRK